MNAGQEPRSGDGSSEPEERRPIPVTIQPPSWRWILTLLGVIFAVWLVAMTATSLLRQLSSLLTWVLVALFASFALEPAVDWLARRGWRRGLATGAILFAIAVVSIVMVGMMIPLVVDQLRALIDAAPDILTNVSGYTERWFNVEISQATIEDQLKNADSNLAGFATNIAGNVFGFASSLVGAIFMLLTVGLFTFYFTADGPRFRRTVLSVLPPARQQHVLWIWEVAIEKTGAYLYSRLLLALVSGVATFIVLSVLEIPFAVPLSLWMGLVSQFIPTVGTYIAMALPLLVTVVESPWKALILLVFFTLYQQLENYVLSPRITAKTMELHAAVAFGCAIAGASIAGLIGALIALPVAAIVQAVVSSALDRHDVIEADLTREIDPEEARQAMDEQRRRARARGEGLVAAVRKRLVDEPDLDADRPDDG
ncbi:MAG TPA: AI-2E family transporter [Actinomycetota bacterium]|nr:AI-2E family transporter [Actinomycetota bacterium]